MERSAHGLRTAEVAAGGSWWTASPPGHMAGVCWHGTSWLCNRTHLIFEQRAASVREGEGGEVGGFQEKSSGELLLLCSPLV